VVEFAKVPSRPESPLRAVGSHFAILLRFVGSAVARRNTVSAVATQKSMRAEVSVVARMMRNAKLSSF